MSSSLSPYDVFQKGAVWRPRKRASDSSIFDAPAWYACYTHARAEKRVDGLLARRGIPSFLPLVSLVRQWHDRRRTVSFPLFPSYVFARFDGAQMGSLLRLPGVVNIVRFNGRPAAIPDTEIENIARFARGLADSGFVPPPPVEFEPGQKVTIVSGPFAGVEAVVCELRGHHRVVVGLQSIRIGFEVNVPIESLKSDNGNKH